MGPLLPAMPVLRLLSLAASIAVCAASSAYHPVHRAALAQPEHGVLPLAGNLLPLAIFYTTVQVGSPPRSFNVSVDTGSTDLLVPLAGCKGCKEGTAVFDPKSSSSSAIEQCNKTLQCPSCKMSPSDPAVSQCGFKDSYLTCDLSNLTALCTVSGVIYRDAVTMAGLSAKDVRFGGIDVQTTNFDQFKQIDGILGLAYAGDSRGTQMGFDVSPFERIVEQNYGLDDVIQTCLTSEGGLLVFGRDRADSSYYEGALQWSPITLEAWYTVNATALYVNEATVNVSLLQLNGPFPTDPCIVDSGTNFLSLTAPAFDGVVQLFHLLCRSGSTLKGVCSPTTVEPMGHSLFGGKAMPLSTAERAAFPNVEIDLVGIAGRRDVRLPIGPEEYFVRLPDGTYRLGITMGDCIIGNTHMLKYWTVYDRANKRMGFAPARRDKCAAKRLALMA